MDAHRMNTHHGREQLERELVNGKLKGFSDSLEDDLFAPKLHQLRQQLSADVEGHAAPIINGSYCSLVFLRHIFSREAIPIAIGGSDYDKAKRTFQWNYRHGLQPVLRVLDSLYEVKARRPVSCFLRTRFAQEVGGGLESLRCIKLPSQIGRTASDLTIDHVAMLEAPGNWHIHWPTSDDQPRPVFHEIEEGLPDFATSAQLFAAHQPLFPACLSAAATVCAHFQMDSNSVAYRSLIAALYELNRYSNDFGGEAVTILFRSNDPTSFATGLTLISNRHIEDEECVPILKCIRQYHANLCEGLIRGPTDSSKISGVLAQIRAPSYEAKQELEDATTWKIGTAIRQRILEHVGLTREETHFLAPHAGLNEKAVPRSVQDFLNMCSVFCEARQEGRKLEFGLVLGNPYMFRHWPGARPLPLMKPDAEGKYQNLWPEELVKQIHLIEGPQHRFLVFPYLAAHGQMRTDKSGYDVTTFVLDLANFQDSIAAWPQGLMWSSTGRVYAYLTHHYPWAVAAHVGPGSHIRVFSCGRLVAFRDGKGWLMWRDPRNGIREALSKGKKPGQRVEATNEDLDRLMGVLEVAIQLSPMVCPESHGALFLWTRRVQNYSNGDIELQPLTAIEPARLDPELQPWLSKNSLMTSENPRKNGVSVVVPRLSYEVAKLVLRAAITDGAVCFADEQCGVHKFGQRVVISGGGAAGDRGTKHATAEAFAKAAGSGAFAIAVSSDGPISIYYNGAEGRFPCFVRPSEIGE